MKNRRRKKAARYERFYEVSYNDSGQGRNQVGLSEISASSLAQRKGKHWKAEQPSVR